MITIEKFEVFNFEGAIRGMRNPLNSWEKSDSIFDQYGFDCGKNDLALMRKLCRAGSDHRKFLRQIMVSMDITAPLYWWKEFDTYKVGTVANSCSTMHTIHKKEFTLGDFSHEHMTNGTLDVLDCIVEQLNFCRRWFLSDGHKDWWWQMIQLLPTSYNQKRTVALNYEVLLNMYHARRNHRLDEWKAFCEVIEMMPYAKELICNVD